MALVIADRVQETTTTTGTGTVTLLGAVTGFQSFAAIGNGNSTFYCITGGTEWENGIGTYTSAGTTLSRTTVLSSSNSGSLVNFSAGTKNVFVTYPAERSINLDDTGNLPQAVTAGLGTGRLPVEQMYRLNANYTPSAVNTAQSVLGPNTTSGLTLVGSTVYQFELVFCIAKSASTTSHTIGVSFGGTATLNNIGYSLIYAQSSTTGAVNGQPASNSNQFFVEQASNTVFTPSITTASQAVYPVIRGNVSVNAGGTFIPQFTMSAAQAYVVQAGSYFKISPLGASGANTNIGTWA